MTSKPEDFPLNLRDLLTVDQRNKIDNLQVILNDRSQDQCLNVLESNCWSIEASVDSVKASKSEALETSYMDSSTGVYNFDNSAKKTLLPKHISNEIQISDNVERISSSPVISKELHPWLFKFIMWTSKPVNFTFSMFNLMLKYLFFWRTSEAMSPDVLGSYESKLMELLSVSLLIPHSDTGSVALFLGNFEEAVAQAKYEYKFLLVYLHKLGNNKADSFLNNSLLHSEVINILNDPENMLIWAGHLNNSEGQEVLQLLKRKNQLHDDVSENCFLNPLPKLFECPEIPFLFSLLSVSSNSTGIKLTLIGQLEKCINATELKEVLLNWIEIGSRPRLKAKRDKMSRDAVNNLRKMQDIAFNEQLEKDKQHEAQRVTELNKERLIKSKKEMLRNKLFNFSDTNSEKEHIFNCYVQLLIQMPNGRRFEYKFDVSTSVKILYYVVYCQEDAPNNFEILWNYPRQVLNCKPTSFNQSEFYLEPQTGDPSTFIHYGIVDNQVVLVRDLDL